MGLFSPYVYKNKRGEKFWLHVAERGKAKLYFFSRERKDALWNLPKGFEVFESPTGFPMIRRAKKGGFLEKFVGKIHVPKKKEQTVAASEQS